VIGLDTPVVVRYLAQDDARQSGLATRLFERTLTAANPGFVSLVSLCQIAWVLAECYGADRSAVREVVEGLLAARQVVVEDSDLVWRALRSWDASAGDFSEALIGQILAARGCARAVTFDTTAAKLPGFELLG